MKYHKNIPGNSHKDPDFYAEPPELGAGAGGNLPIEGINDLNEENGNLGFDNFHNSDPQPLSSSGVPFKNLK